MYKRFLPLVAMCLCLTLEAAAQVGFGDARKFNDDWLFSLSDDAESKSEGYNDEKWRRLSLPHDWSI